MEKLRIEYNKNYLKKILENGVWISDKNHFHEKFHKLEKVQINDKTIFLVPKNYSWQILRK